MIVPGKALGLLLFAIAGVALYFCVRGTGRVERIGRWSTLEREFAVERMPEGATVASGLIGWGRYFDTLEIFWGDRGVFLDLPRIARFGSRPISIPYSEFEISRTNPVLRFGFRTFTQFIVRGQSVCLDVDASDRLIRSREERRAERSGVESHSVPRKPVP